MKRTLVISDIHGCYTPFNDLLALMNYCPGEDQLLLLGDFVDRGPRSKDVVEQVIGLVQKDGAIAIQGNHDERLVDVMLERNEQALLKFSGHGGRQTAESYAGIKQGPIEHVIECAKAAVHEHYPHHMTFLDNLPYYHEDEHFIYVHAGLNPNYLNWKDQPQRDFLYIKQPFLTRPTNVNKTVVFGHTKTIDIHGKPDIWFGPGKIGVDGGCANGHQLNGLAITGADEFKTYSVPWRL
ncbi:metallophosphoesterase [Paenibacillus sp. FJAT-27812]|uniref:metallophosphoesterase n=1 Tax=Paenibacillus sp. FJAT-27812 TaxID=1684143 RepID=UPI0006A7E5BB|nr:metallophosphoesterase [Paenibacillus sp. FJAT-27812]